MPKVELNLEDDELKEELSWQKNYLVTQAN